MTKAYVAALAHQIGTAVRAHRKAASLTQKELADLAEIGKTAVFDIEAGKQTVRLATLFRVLHVLNIRLRLDSPLEKRGHEE